MRLAFVPPLVVQIRNSHNYLADFDSEEPLYKRSLKLVEQLSLWRSSLPTLPGRIEALWIFLFERGYIELKDVQLVQAWLQSLLAAGYRFPTFAEKARGKSVVVAAAKVPPHVAHGNNNNNNNGKPPSLRKPHNNNGTNLLGPKHHSEGAGANSTSRGRFM